MPRIPEKGSVGASGDLAPLAHLTLGLMGIGEMWSPESGWGNAEEVGIHVDSGNSEQYGIRVCLFFCFLFFRF